MAFLVEERGRKFPFFWRKWNALTHEGYQDRESAERWMAMLKRCDMNFGYSSEYRIREVDNG